MRKPQKRIQRNLDRRTRPATTIAGVKQAFDLSDLEVTDAYNEFYGTALPCPLPEKLAPRAMTAARRIREAAESL